MSESTLSLSYTDLQVRVADFLGYGLGTAHGDEAWGTRETYTINDCVNSGLRQFYNPPNVEGIARAGYEWSFLKPVASLALSSGEYQIQLPDDFGGIEGMITVTASGSQFSAIKVRGTDDVRQARAANGTETTGSPAIASVVPLKTGGGMGLTTGQRFELQIYPTANQAYTLGVAYYLHGNALTTARPYPYGGAAHAETILESCLAIAEERRDNQRGVHVSKFMERLRASIIADRKMKGQSLGYNGDSSETAMFGSRGWRDQVVVSLNGVTPT